MKRVTAVQFTLHLPAKIAKKKKWFLASCPVLDIHSQGETEEQAKKNLTDALTLFFISCYERDMLDAALKECGFKAVHQPVIDVSTIPEKDFIDVPIPFHIIPGAHKECHA